MAKNNSLLAGPTATTNQAAPKANTQAVYDNEPNLKNPNLMSRTKSPRQMPEVRRVLGTVSGRLPQPSSKK